MEAAAYRTAKMQVVEQMLQGQSWHEAVAAASLWINRSTAYQLLNRVRTEAGVGLHRWATWTCHQTACSAPPLAEGLLV